MLVREDSQILVWDQCLNVVGCRLAAASLEVAEGKEMKVGIFSTLRYVCAPADHSSS